MPDVSSTFQKDPSITFWVILYTHTDRQTKTGKNITFLAEVISHGRSSEKVGRGDVVDSMHRDFCLWRTGAKPMTCVRRWALVDLATGLDDKRLSEWLGLYLPSVRLTDEKLLILARPLIDGEIDKPGGPPWGWQVRFDRRLTTNNSGDTRYTHGRNDGPTDWRRATHSDEDQALVLQCITSGSGGCFPFPALPPSFPFSRHFFNYPLSFFVFSSFFAFPSVFVFSVSFPPFFHSLDSAVGFRECSLFKEYLHLD